MGRCGAAVVLRFCSEEKGGKHARTASTGTGNGGSANASPAGSPLIGSASPPSTASASGGGGGGAAPLNLNGGGEIALSPMSSSSRKPSTVAQVDSRLIPNADGDVEGFTVMDMRVPEGPTFSVPDISEGPIFTDDELDIGRKWKWTLSFPLKALEQYYSLYYRYATTHALSSTRPPPSVLRS